MEKYAKLMKGLEVCAGPDCCKDGCPYYGKTTGTMTCRARLLADAAIAINNEQNLRESAEEGLRNAVEELGKLHDDVDDLEAASNTLRAERDGMRIELANAVEMRRSVEAHRDAIESDRADITRERDNLRIRYENIAEMRNKLVADNVELRKECDMLATRCTVLQNEINALVLKMGGKHDGKTDRPSVEDKELMAEVCKMICEAKYQEGRADALAEIVERCSFGGGSRHE